MDLSVSLGQWGWGAVHAYLTTWRIPVSSKCERGHWYIPKASSNYIFKILAHEKGLLFF